MAVANFRESERQWQRTCDGGDMNELTRKVDASFSPKSSPRGSRSPMATPNLSRNDSTGTLKMTISAGKHPAVVHSGPFYLMKVRGLKPCLEYPSWTWAMGSCGVCDAHDFLVGFAWLSILSCRQETKI